MPSNDPRGEKSAIGWSVAEQANDGKRKDT